MTDEQIDELFSKYGDQVPEDDRAARAAAWGRTFDEAKRISRAAWEAYGVDPDDPCLKWRNDGSSRIGPNGEVLGGGLPAAQWGTTKGLIEKGWTCADLPAGYATGSYERNGEIVLRSAHAAPVQQDSGGNLLIVAIFAVIAAVIVALPFVVLAGM